MLSVQQAEGGKVFAGWTCICHRMVSHGMATIPDAGLCDGATGVEGVMSKCSEGTLRVLRANKESLLTILEVFIHDPLYKWQLTSARAQQRQKADTLPQHEAGMPSLPPPSHLQYQTASALTHQPGLYRAIQVLSKLCC